MKDCVFVQVRCQPGETQRVTRQIARKKLHAEMFSTSGEFDLMMKIYVPQEYDTGRFLFERVLNTTGIERTQTTMVIEHH